MNSVFLSFESIGTNIFMRCLFQISMKYFKIFSHHFLIRRFSFGIKNRYRWLGHSQTIIHRWLLTMDPRNDIFDYFMSGKCWRTNCIKWLTSIIGNMVTMEHIQYQFLHFTFRLIVEHWLMDSESMISIWLHSWTKLTGWNDWYVFISTWFGSQSKITVSACWIKLLDRFNGLETLLNRIQNQWYPVQLADQS